MGARVLNRRIVNASGWTADKDLNKAINRMPAFMHPEYERIQTWDDLVYLVGVEIDIAEGGGMDPPWTPAQFARAKAYEKQMKEFAAEHR